MSALQFASSLAPEEREALGIDPESPLKTIVIDRGDVPGTESKIESHPSFSWSHEQLVAQLEYGDSFIPLNVPEGTFTPWLGLSRWSQNRNVAVVSSAASGNTALYGDCAWLDDTTILLDARTRPAYAIWNEDDRTRLLRVLNGTLTLFEGATAKWLLQHRETRSWGNGSSFGLDQQLRRAEQALLGLAREVQLRLVERKAAPASLSPVRGRPPGDTLKRHDELLRALSVQRESVRTHFLALQHRLPGTEIEHWAHDTRIAFLKWNENVTCRRMAAFSGFWRLLDERVAILDSRTRPAYVQGRCEGLGWVLRCYRGNLELFEETKDTVEKNMGSTHKQQNGAMNHLAQEELEMLGFPRDMELDLVERAALPSGDEGRAHGVPVQLPHTRVDWEALLEHLHERIPLQLDSLRALLPGGELSSWQREQRVLFLATTAQQPSIRFAGAWSWIRDGLAFLDVRERPAYVLGHHDDLVWVLRMEQTGLMLFMQSKWPADTNWEPSKPPEIPAPDIDRLLGQTVVQTWLLKLAKEFAESRRPFKRVAAAGVLARLWSSPNKTSRERTQKWLSAGHMDPTAAAVKWFQMLEADQQELIESSAIYEWHEIEKEFEDIIELNQEDPDSIHEMARAWIHRRDDLQSVMFLLRRADIGSAIARGLSKFDARAAAYRELWSLIDLRDDERLCSVSWQEPDSWWGSIVVTEDSSSD
ncbi:hypothetical protein [Corallococcus sp. CA053C]|uniref:hypothetical protein n=1 Tax=Corallococcus sp. CA053C TaxID=2316732 RepID=UPI0011C472B5|nr:hypothetical protein [Corallococcus sp. CA053C]